MLPNPIVLASVCSLNGFIKSAKVKTGGRGAHYFQCIKSLLAFCCPLNWLFLIGGVVPRDLVTERVGDLGIPLYEVLVIACKPQEASQLCNHESGGPILKSFNLMTISLDTLFGNLMP